MCALPSFVFRFWMAYEAVQTILQLLALVLLFTYTCKYIPEARVRTL